MRYVCALIYVRDIVINSVTGRDKRFFGCTVILEISMYGRTRKTKIYHRIRGGEVYGYGGTPAIYFKLPHFYFAFVVKI